MTDSKNKERTSITIDPALLASVREYCKDASVRQSRRVSFSEIVSIALQNYIGDTDDCEESNV